MSQYNLTALRDSAERACIAAFDKREKIEGAINWGDLHCNVAERYEDSSGGTGYRVYIEEASPDQPALGEFINGVLMKDGFDQVEIMFEW